MTAMIRKHILLSDDLIDAVEAVSETDGVSFAETVRDLLRRGAMTPDTGTTNPFGLDDDILAGMLDLALESADHVIGEVDKLLATLEAREAAKVREP